MLAFASRIKRPLRSLAIATFAMALCFPRPAPGDPPPPRVHEYTGPVLVGHVDGAIGPATALYVERLLREATRRDSPAVVIALDTPGGLSDSMREIIQAILASPVPVVTYVSPQGARAASAGALISLSAHVSAMAPGTNIGAAHPVTIGPGGNQGQDSTMVTKVTNDAAAYARGIAMLRNRNVEWAERVVRESISSTADEALEDNVIDVIAGSIPDLLAAIDGRAVEMSSPDDQRPLQVKSAAVEELPPTWRERFLFRISDPNIAYLLMLAGVFGLFFELQNPGSILPGVVGALSLLTAAFALHMLPVNWAGAGLLLLALVLFVLEVKVTSHGLLTVGGVIAMLFGSLMLIDSPLPFMRVSLGVIVPSVIFTALFFLFAVGMAVRAQRNRVTTGREGLIGLVGSVRGTVGPDGGSVFVRGEFWNAVSDETLSDGTRVRVVRVDGLTVRVERTRAE